MYPRIRKEEVPRYLPVHAREPLLILHDVPISTPCIRVVPEPEWVLHFVFATNTRPRNTAGTAPSVHFWISGPVSSFAGGTVDTKTK